MNSYAMKIKLPVGELKRILVELTQAQETIRKCYDRLYVLGFIEIEAEKAVSPKD